MAVNNTSILSIAGSALTTPGTYVQLSASTPSPTSKLVIVNTTAAIVVLGSGASGSEVGLVAARPGDQLVIPLGLIMLGGTRLAVYPLDVAGASGTFVVSLMP